MNTTRSYSNLLVNVSVFHLYKPYGRGDYVMSFCSSSSLVSCLSQSSSSLPFAFALPLSRGCFTWMSIFRENLWRGENKVHRPQYGGYRCEFPMQRCCCLDADEKKKWGHMCSDSWRFSSSENEIVRFES